jgi:MFS family permease
MSANKFTPEYAIEGTTTDNSDEIFADATGDGIRRASVAKVTKVSAVVTVIVAGLALFSDGYNAQIIGYM